MQIDTKLQRKPSGEMMWRLKDRRKDRGRKKIQGEKR